jgi:hypothetical protein
MNKKYIAYGVVVIVALVGLVVYYANKPSVQSQAVADCVSKGGKFDIGSNICIVGLVTGVSTEGTSGSIPKYAPPQPVINAAATPKPNTITAKVTLPPPGVSVYYVPTSTVSSLIEVDSPPTNSSITSPVTISGKAVGTWFFEGVFPVLLVDRNGRILAEGSAKATSNWQTTDFVPFLTSLSFARQTSGSYGVMILKKDNPSSNPANDAAVEIPVQF